MRAASLVFVALLTGCASPTAPEGAGAESMVYALKDADLPRDVYIPEFKGDRADFKSPTNPGEYSDFYIGSKWWLGEIRPTNAWLQGFNIQNHTLDPDVYEVVLFEVTYPSRSEADRVAADYGCAMGVHTYRDENTLIALRFFSQRTTEINEKFVAKHASLYRVC